MHYKLGHVYVDKGSRKNPEDQFLRWVNLDGSGMLNSPGIRPLSFISSNIATDLPAYLILVTHDTTSGQLNPWDDIVDLSKAEIWYWGDAKGSRDLPVDGFDGNKVLRKIYDYILTGQRALVPPILHFSKPKRGFVQLNGLCVLDRLDISWFDDNGKPIQNYHAKLTILDCALVSLLWLHERARAEDASKLDLHPDCPISWLKYKKGNKTPLDIWMKKIRPKTAQLPAPESPEAKVLDQLLSLNPFEFEKVIVSIFKQMPEITHHISGTKSTGDGGVDFFGTFRLPQPVNYEIGFRGEVKRYAASTSVDPKSVSRLVARLNRKEYGIFVTTSYFTEQAQREVLQDHYPVHLIPGIDLVNMLKHLRLVNGGEINTEWLKSVTTKETDL